MESLGPPCCSWLSFCGQGDGLAVFLLSSKSGLQAPTARAAGVCARSERRDLQIDQTFRTLWDLPEFEGLWFIECHEYWARSCDFEMCMHTTYRLTKTFSGWYHRCLHFHIVIFQLFMYQGLVDGCSESEVVGFWCRGSLFSHISPVRFCVASKLTRNVYCGLQFRSSSS